MAYPVNYAAWTDFTNNFITDAGPFLALFGEQATKQYLSGSTTFSEHVLFGLMPIGILTAVVAVIRLYSGKYLRNLIGRAREPIGLAEVELCSSTSQDVCEIWTNTGVCRMSGNPQIVELIHRDEKARYTWNPEFRNRSHFSSAVDTSWGLHNIYDSKDFFRRSLNQTYGNEWHNVRIRPGQDYTLDSGASPHFAPYPNLTLNTLQRGLLCRRRWAFIVITGVVQLANLAYAAFATCFRPAWYDDENRPTTTALVVYVAGSGLLTAGMIRCAWLVDQKSCEQRYVRPRDNKPITRLVWIQRGGGKIADQETDSFFHSVEIDEYVTSWREDQGFKHCRVHMVIACALAVVGFASQCFGLRGLHGSVALFQTVSSLIATALRTSLRIQHNVAGSQPPVNLTSRGMRGRELDWASVYLASLSDDLESKKEAVEPEVYRWSLSEYQPTASGWPETIVRASIITKAMTKDIMVFDPVHHTLTCTPQEFEEARTQCANAALHYISSIEAEGSRIHHAARVFHVRASLARLWSPKSVQFIQESSALQISAVRKTIERAICHQHGGALVFRVGCRISGPPKAMDQVIHFLVWKVGTAWRICRDQFEAAVALWALDRYGDDPGGGWIDNWGYVRTAMRLFDLFIRALRSAGMVTLSSYESAVSEELRNSHQNWELRIGPLMNNLEDHLRRTLASSRIHTLGVRQRSSRN